MIESHEPEPRQWTSSGPFAPSFCGKYKIYDSDSVHIMGSLNLWWCLDTPGVHCSWYSTPRQYRDSRMSALGMIRADNPWQIYPEPERHIKGLQTQSAPTSLNKTLSISRQQSLRWQMRTKRYDAAPSHIHPVSWRIYHHHRDPTMLSLFAKYTKHAMQQYMVQNLCILPLTESGCICPSDFIWPSMGSFTISTHSLLRTKRLLASIIVLNMKMIICIYINMERVISQPFVRCRVHRFFVSMTLSVYIGWKCQSHTGKSSNSQMIKPLTRY